MTVQQLCDVLSTLDPSAIVYLREDEVDVVGPYIAMEDFLNHGTIQTARPASDDESEIEFER